MGGELPDAEEVAEALALARVMVDAAARLLPGLGLF